MLKLAKWLESKTLLTQRHTANKAKWETISPTAYNIAYLAFLSKTGEKTSKKFSFASLLEGTVLSKVGSILLNARLFRGSDKIS